MSAPTPQQQAAILARGNVLVAAGAGTGKTSAVTDRCLDLVLRERVALERILMVTFTEAAATEMRERLGRKLRAAADRLAADSADGRWLAEQLALLETAPISTLHSFCLELVRRHFHVLELDPQFTVLDESQTRPLLRAGLDELFRRHYAGNTEADRAVRELVRDYGRGSDRAIRELILKLHTHTQSLAAPDHWYGEQLAMYASETPVRWRDWLAEGVAEWAWQWRPVLQALPESCANTDAANDALATLLTGEVSFARAGQCVETVRAADEQKWVRGTVTRIRKPIEKFYEEARFLAGLAGNDGASLAADWDAVRTPMQTLLRLAREFADIFAAAKRELGGIDFADQEQFALRLLYDASGRVTEIARDCRERFEQVFVDECQDINAAQDAIIRAVCRDAGNRFLVGDVKQSIYRFRQANPRIFQEYQSQWSAEPGDWAGRPLPAVPGKSDDGAHGVTRPASQGRVFPLTGNFRSREGLLDFVNQMFAVLMQPALGGLGYGEDEALQFGAPDQRRPLSRAADAGPRVELHVITRDEAGESGGEAESDSPAGTTRGGDVVDVTGVEREAGLIARRLRQLKESGHRVWHPERYEFAPADYGDMVVLVRSLAGRGEMFAKAFHQEGVPLLAARGGFLEASEVTDLLNLLKLLDNPLQDLPLLAVLRSPLAGFKPDELVLLRTADARGLLWFALRKAAGSGAPPTHELPHRNADLSRQHRPGILPLPAKAGVPVHGHNSRPPAVDSLPTLSASPSEGEGWGEGTAVHGQGEPHPAAERPDSFASKATGFLSQFARWRELIRHTSLTQCLETALAETYYEALLLAGPRGAERVANVRRLVDLARRFDPYQREGLFRFLQFIREQEEAEVRHEPAAPTAQNAVRLMTIHASKGLEFPVVVLAGLGTGFNLADLNGDILLSESLGLCPKVFAPATRRRYPSVAHWLGRRREQQAALGEELRLLYVALTRARDTLLLVGTAARKNELDRWAASGPVTELALLKAGRLLDWVRLWFGATQASGTGNHLRAGGNALVAWRFHDAASELLAKPNVAARVADAAIPEPTPAEVQSLRARLTWRYPHEGATTETAKTTVTALRRRAEETDDEARKLFPSPRFARHAGPAAPGNVRLSPAEVGVAHHTFLQLMELEHCASELDLRNQATRLEAAGALTATELAALDLAALARFWQSELGREIRRHAAHVHRELPFTARLSAAELKALGLPLANPALPDDEFLVVQGIADLALILPKEIWLLDFKTDDVTAETLDPKVKQYQPQLGIYALALAKIYRRPVTNCWLHFLAANHTERLPAVDPQHQVNGRI